MAKSASATDIFPYGDSVEPLLHGGDLGTARRLFPGAPKPFIDLSTGINPHRYPLPRLPADLFSRLPDSDALGHLRTVAAGLYGAPSAAYAVVAPGTQILLPLVARLAPPGRAAVLSPTYSEHARAAALAGHCVQEVCDVWALGNADLAIVSQPNNPDGRLLTREALLALAQELRPHGGMLIVDEAFMDVAPPDASLASEIACGNVIVLRSVGKFFGLAGMRLGFALLAPRMAARLSASLGPWAVSGPALAVGAKALADHAWIRRMRGRLAEEAQRLDAMLTGFGLEIVGGTTLFRLMRTPAAGALFHHLGRAGILVRPFPDNPAWLRFGLPGSERGWQRLQIAMAASHDNS